MFDIGFWELSLVALVALLVIGPERLPKVARLAGFWIGKGQRMVSSVRHEIKVELYAEELRQRIKDQSPETEIREIMDDTSQVAKSLSKVPEDLEKTLESAPQEKSNPTSQKPHGTE